MIIRDDDPHYSDRGRQQMVSNLLYLMKHALPALYEYADIVNDYFEKSQADPSIPSPRARFYRRSSKHTGIPETPKVSGSSSTTSGQVSTSSDVPSSGSQAPVKPPQSSKDWAPQDTTRKPVSVGRLVKSMATPMPSYAAVAAAKEPSPPQSTSVVSPGARSKSMPSAPAEETVHFPATDYRERLPHKKQQTDTITTPATVVTHPTKPDQAASPPAPGVPRDGSVPTPNVRLYQN